MHKKFFYKVNYSVFLFIFLIIAQGCVRNGKRGSGIKEKNYRTNIPYLVVLSMDGFRWDYPLIYDTPSLDSIAASGVKSQELIPCFPSKTFPNHYSMATGLYPEHHGIVQNSFYDTVLGEYRLSDRKAVSNPEFYFGEPIWVTAEKQFIRSACFYWPGSEAPIKGVYPDIYKEYDGSVSFEARIDSVITWLEKPVKERPHLVMWYFDEPDHTGHEYGPESLQTKRMVEHIDSLVGIFCRKIRSLSIADSVNLVFTSDHGMQPISPDRAIALDRLLKDRWVNRVGGANPVLMIDPNAGCSDSIMLALKNTRHLKIYTKSSLPKSLHYSDSDRIFDIVCVADSAWSIYWKAGHFSTGGTHGYDPSNRNMHAVFYATGPAFVKNYVAPPFQNIHLYPLFARILGLVPATTDGSLPPTAAMLRENAQKETKLPLSGNKN